jgi:UDP-glucuronate 4-epimerase
LRFFTVYGPWGRPDMAAYDFLFKIENGRPITIYNGGHMWRDMTFVSDIVDGIIASVAFVGSPSDPQVRGGRPPVLNLGNDQPVSVNRLIEVIEEATGKTAMRKDGGPSRGEIERTHADVQRARCWLQYQPKTSIEQGIKKTYEWYTASHRPSFLTGRFTEKVDLA